MEAGTEGLSHDLELRGIAKSFGKTVAVNDVHLAVSKGEFIALLGPSGCGKTTTLRIIAGFEHPDAGEVRIKNRPVTNLPSYRRDIGMVFQNYALFPHMNVFENVAYGLRRRKFARAQVGERVARVLDMVQLHGLERSYPRYLSGGQQQRVAVARAIVIQPSVLLLDEPLSNLDAKLRQQMRGELRRLQRRLEIATVFVTHDQDEALAMADRIVVMSHGGHVEQIDTPEAIYTRPRTRFVATFIGECNFLSVKVIAINAGIADLQAGALTLRSSTHAASLPVAARGTLSLRPEDLRLFAPSGPRPEYGNVVDGRVRDVTYLGTSQHYWIVVAESLELLVHSHGRYSGQFHEGDAVKVAWDPSVGVLYGDDMTT